LTVACNMTPPSTVVLSALTIVITPMLDWLMRSARHRHDNCEAGEDRDPARCRRSYSHHEGFLVLLGFQPAQV